MHRKFWLENLIRSEHLGDMGVGGIILKLLSMV